MEGAELVQQLLAGSKRINEMRKEIDDTVSIVLGFQTKAEFSRFKHLKYQDWIHHFESGGLQWIIEKSKSSISMFIIDKNRPELGFIYFPGLDIPLQYVQPIRQGLPDFLANMVKIFPQLEERWAPLLKVAKMKVL